jgi:hypothetical protein
LASEFIEDCKIERRQDAGASLFDHFDRQSLLAGNEKLGRRDSQLIYYRLDSRLDTARGPIIVQRCEN